MHIILTKTTTKAEDGTVLDYTETETHHYTILELRDEVDDAITSYAYQEAISKLAYIQTDYDWWSDDWEWLESEVLERFGITFKGSLGTFDLDRGSYFTFGPDAYVSDPKTFLRKARIDLRTKTARDLIEDGIRIVAVSAPGGIRYNEIDTPWDIVVDPDTTQALEDTLNDARHYCLDHLRQQYDYLTSEENALEAADANGYMFDASGNLV